MPITPAQLHDPIVDYVQPAGFGLNGIRVLPSGDLIAVSGGVLYVIDPVTGTADRVEVTGEQLTAGDGLVLHGRTLYVVRGYDSPDAARDRDSVVELRLSRSLRTAASRTDGWSASGMPISMPMALTGI